MTRTRRARARAARGLNCQTCAVVAPGAPELELPDGLDEAGALALLATRLRVQAARPRTADRVLLDTFDARLRAAGLRAEWPARRAPVRKLALHEAGVAVRRADVADAPVGLRALPPGPLRERLAPALGRPPRGVAGPSPGPAGATPRPGSGGGRPPAARARAQPHGLRGRPQR